MTDAREQILARVRRALTDVPEDEQPADVPVARDYRLTNPGTGGTATLVELFATRLREYGAAVLCCRSDEVGTRLGAECAVRGLDRIVTAPQVPASWLPIGVESIPDKDQSPHELDRLGAAMTGCLVAIAETGTLVLDGGPLCGRRVLTLIADCHICVVETAQIVDAVPRAIAEITPAVVGERRPITMISGPSASSDIELVRVEGVHGPRDLLVVIAD